MGESDPVMHHQRVSKAVLQRLLFCGVCTRSWDVEAKAETDTMRQLSPDAFIIGGVYRACPTCSAVIAEAAERAIADIRSKYKGGEPHIVSAPVEDST